MEYMVYEVMITKMMIKSMMMMSRTNRSEKTNDSAAVRELAEVEAMPYLDHLRRRLVG